MVRLVILQSAVVGLVLLQLTACGLFGGKETTGTDGLFDGGFGDDDDAGDDDDDTTGTTGTSTTRDDPSAPQILSLTTSAPSLTQFGSLLITVILTDPDGLQDLVGGELLTPEGSSYGTFLATGEGTFQFELSWSHLNEMELIDFESGSIIRNVVARFFDAAGHRTQANIPIELYCDEGGACAGTCGIDLNNDRYNCGQCNRYCYDSLFFGGTCQQGTCVTWTACATAGQTCNQVCTQQGLGPCIQAEELVLYGTPYPLGAAGLGGNTCYGNLYIVETCNEPIPFGAELPAPDYGTFDSVYCACEQ